MLGSQLDVALERGTLIFDKNLALRAPILSICKLIWWVVEPTKDSAALPLTIVQNELCRTVSLIRLLAHFIQQIFLQLKFFSNEKTEYAYVCFDNVVKDYTQTYENKLSSVIRSSQEIADTFT